MIPNGLLEAITDRLHETGELPSHCHHVYLIDAASRSVDAELRAAVAGMEAEPLAGEVWAGLVEDRTKKGHAGTLTEADVRRAFVHHRESLELVAPWWAGGRGRTLLTIVTGARRADYWCDCAVLFSEGPKDLRCGVVWGPGVFLSAANAVRQADVGLASWFRGRRFARHEDRKDFEHASATVLYRLPLEGTWRGGEAPWPPVDWEAARRWSKPTEQIPLFAGVPGVTFWEEP